MRIKLNQINKNADYAHKIHFSGHIILGWKGKY